MSCGDTNYPRLESLILEDIEPEVPWYLYHSPFFFLDDRRDESEDYGKSRTRMLRFESVARLKHGESSIMVGRIASASHFVWFCSTHAYAVYHVLRISSPWRASFLTTLLDDMDSEPVPYWQYLPHPPWKSHDSSCSNICYELVNCLHFIVVKLCALAASLHPLARYNFRRETEKTRLHIGNRREIRRWVERHFTTLAGRVGWTRL